MKIHDAFPSRWLTAADVEPSLDVTVRGVTVEEIGKDRETKPVVWFDETDKGLVCNKTNFVNLAKICGGDESDEWTGRTVQLYSTQVQFGGEEVAAVRVRQIRAPVAMPTQRPAAAAPAARPAAGNAGRPGPAPARPAARPAQRAQPGCAEVEAGMAADADPERF